MASIAGTITTSAADVTMMYIRRRPNRSPSQPTSGMVRNPTSEDTMTTLALKLFCKASVRVMNEIR